jgi:tellurite resistance protein
MKRTNMMDTRAMQHPHEYRLVANIFGVSFGLAGLAQSWSTAAKLAGVPDWPGNVLWAVTAAVWLATAMAFAANLSRTTRWREQLTDPTFAPFVALAFIVPMLFGQALAAHARHIGEAVFAAGLAGVVILGGWLTSQWIVTDMPLDRWHPGYFLPTVAGGLLAAGGCAALGFAGLARLMFGYGAICWLLLGSILLLRLFTGPPLPRPLLPTMAIELAPPVVAGNAWFEINGERADTLALALAGYAALMALVQIGLVPTYARVPFSPGSWAFAFSYAAGFTVSIRWLAVQHVEHQRGFTYLLLATITTGVGLLAVRTVSALVRGSFLPSLPGKTAPPAPLAHQPAAPS